MSEHDDVIVIGSGAGGCILTCALAGTGACGRRQVAVAFLGDRAREAARRRPGVGGAARGHVTGRGSRHIAQSGGPSGITISPTVAKPWRSYSRRFPGEVASS